MAVSQITPSRTDDRLSVVRINRALPDLIGRLIAWNGSRVTRNALMQLTDRELDDIGIGRGDIDAIARRAGR